MNKKGICEGNFMVIVNKDYTEIFEVHRLFIKEKNGKFLLCCLTYDEQLVELQEHIERSVLVEVIKKLSNIMYEQVLLIESLS